jgi:hypothetical protein
MTGVANAAVPTSPEASMPDTSKPPTGEPDEAPQDEPASADSAEPDAPAFANRAERRARGKGKPAAQAQSSEKGRTPGGRGTVQTPRLWGNRRTG